jgi:hypothetical protein
MSKIHLRGNAKTDTNVARSICSLQSMGNGKVRANGREKYRFMASEVVSFTVFREVPSADRCAHCVDMGLIKRNKQRKAKGWKEVERIEDAYLQQE